MILEISHNNGIPTIKLTGECTSADLAIVLSHLLSNEYSNLLSEKIGQICTEDQIKKIQKIVVGDLIRRTSMTRRENDLLSLESALQPVVTSIVDNREKK